MQAKDKSLHLQGITVLLFFVVVSVCRPEHSVNFIFPFGQKCPAYYNYKHPEIMDNNNCLDFFGP